MRNKSTKIEVTKEDIENGNRYCAYTNPIAKSIDRTYELLWGKKGLIPTTNFSCGEGQYFYKNKYFKMPPELTEWLVKFDSGKCVDNISFEFAF